MDAHDDGGDTRDLAAAETARIPQRDWSAARPNRVARADTTPTSGSRLTWMGSTPIRTGIVCGIVAGTAGSLLQGSVSGSSARVRVGVMVGLVSVLLGLLLNSWQSVAARSWRKAFGRAVLGAICGSTFGLLALLLGDVLFESTFEEPGDPLVPVVVTLWALVGASAGAGVGLARASWSRTSWGLLGGALGGALGGLFYGAFAAEVNDRGALVVHGHQAQTYLAVVIACAGIGLGIGIADRVRRRVWITVVEGPTRGMEFLVDKRRTTIGAAHRCDIVLTQDDAVAPLHATVVVDVNGVHLEAEAPCDHDGEERVGTFTPEPNAVLRFGNTYVRIDAKATAAAAERSNWR